jgi:ankyrin repeat protein
MTTYRDMFNFIIAGNLPGLQKALDEGFDVNEPDQYGFLLVHRACANRQPEIISLLIARGSRLDDAATDGWTPLHLAAVSGAIGCPQILVQAGANPNALDNYGRTPLHLAITSGDPKVAEELIEAGSSKNINNGRGLTPLELAKEKGAAEFYKVLS